MMDSPVKSENPSTRNSVLQSLREKVINKKGLFVLLIILMIAGSVALYLAHIDWEQQVIKYRYFAIFGVMLVSSMTIILPLPGVAVLAVAPSIMNLTGTQIFWLAVVASMGGALGELTAYYAGRLGRGVFSDKQQKQQGRVEHWMRRYGGFTIFTFSMTPLPFDIVGIVAGSLRYPVWQFLLFCWAGRLIKYTFVVYAGTASYNLFF